MKNFILVTHFSLHTLRCTTIFQLPEFLVQNSLSAPTQVFQECGVQSTSLAILRDFGFELFQSSPLPRPLMKTWPDWGTLDLSWSGVSPLEGLMWELVCGDLSLNPSQGLPSRSGYSCLMLYLERYNFW